MDELQAAQAALGRSIGRARAGEDPQLAGLVREKGEQMVGLLFGLMRTSRAYAPGNPALNQPVAELTAALDKLVHLLGALHLVAIEDQIYLNEIRVRTQPQPGGKSLGGELAAHEVGGLTFTVPPTDEQIRALLQCLNAKPAGRAALRNALIARGVASIQPAAMPRLRAAGEGDARLDARTVVNRAMHLIDETWDSVADGRRLNILPLRRVVTDLLEMGPGHEQLWWDPPGASAHALHSFRVCQYALLAGEGIQLEVALQQDLGVAALLHDVGGALPGAGDAHVRAGSLLLLQQPGFHEGKVRRVLAVIDHHRQIVETVSGISTLFGRILHIADDYEHLVRSGVSPARAIGSISGGAGIRYDPVMFQGFINRMGRFPPGSRLRLEDGRVVQSVSVVRSPQTFAAPLCESEAGPVDLAQGGKVVHIL